MISNDLIQVAFISELKADAGVIAILGSGPDGVKEDQYQGSDYNYPGVRVDIIRQVPDTRAEQCDLSRLFATVRCYAEGGSSKTADILAGAVNAALHRALVKGGTIGTDAFYTILRSSGLLGAVRLNENLWRSEAMFEGNIYPSDAMGGI